jgi:hypothetical protein
MRKSVGKSGKGRTLLAALGVAAALGISAAPAMAGEWHDNGHGHGHWDNGRHRGHYKHGPVIHERERVIVRQPVYAAPPPPPVYYAPPANYYQPGFDFFLRVN